MSPAARRRNTWESREDECATRSSEAPPQSVRVSTAGETAATTRVELLWPFKELSPNARVHWAKRASLAKRARSDAAMLARAYGLSKLKANAINASITFHPPDNRHRDLDGMLSSLKSSLDGLADVIGVDDSRWSLSIRKAEARPPHGAVIVEISVAS